MDLHVGIRVAVRATEDPARVERAVLNLFPDARVEFHPHGLVAESRSLTRLAELVASHRIPDTARGVMVRGIDGATSRFLLGKQAAFMGKPNFGPQASPLGEIEVELRAASPEELERAIYACAPDTTVPPDLATVPRSARTAADEERVGAHQAALAEAERAAREAPPEKKARRAR